MAWHRRAESVSRTRVPARGLTDHEADAFAHGRTVEEVIEEERRKLELRAQIGIRNLSRLIAIRVFEQASHEDRPSALSPHRPTGAAMYGSGRKSNEVERNGCREKKPGEGRALSKAMRQPRWPGTRSKGR